MGMTQLNVAHKLNVAGSDKLKIAGSYLKDVITIIIATITAVILIVDIFVDKVEDMINKF